MGENQQQPLFRSINCAERSFVRFINMTPHNINLYWIDYQGQAVSYGVLSPNRYGDINTFVTHPWIFVDRTTLDRCLVNQKDVFFPETPGRCQRADVYITLPLHTLRELSLRAIKKCLRHDRHAFLLDIPRSLQRELAAMQRRNQDDAADRNSEQ